MPTAILPLNADTPTFQFAISSWAAGVNKDRTPHTIILNAWYDIIVSEPPHVIAWEKEVVDYSWRDVLSSAAAILNISLTALATLFPAIILAKRKQGFLLRPLFACCKGCQCGSVERCCDVNDTADAHGQDGIDVERPLNLQ